MQAANEVSDSRVYAGVHFRHSVEQGTKLGKTVGFYVYKNFKCEWGGAEGGTTGMSGCVHVCREWLAAGMIRCSGAHNCG